MALVAISAAYGAAGSRVGPELAERLGVPFIDRGIPIAVAERLDVPLDDAIAQLDQPTGGRTLLERLLAGFAAADSALPSGPAPELVTEEDFHRTSEEVIRELTAGGRGVILGRGAVAALRTEPRALRIRLSGPAEERIRVAMELGGSDEATVRTAQRRLDAAHADYLRRFYGLDIDDPSLYHLVLDATAFPVATIVEMIMLVVGTRSATGR
jgi:cytidylate kinase